MLEIIETRSGVPTAKYNGVYLHSKYDPLTEARRIVAAAIKKPPALCIVLGAGLGYSVSAIREKYPHTKIMTAYTDAEIAHHAQYHGDWKWHPKCGMMFEDFLSKNLAHIDYSNAALIILPAAKQLFSSDIQKLSQQVYAVLAEQNAEIVTLSKFGKRWIQNAICNFIFFEKFASPKTLDRPVVIAASGPSLECAADAIASHRSSVELWALPSAIAALRHKGIFPDLIITSDASFYARQHLDYCPPAIVAAPLTASRGLWKQADAVLLLDQNFILERKLCLKSRIDHIRVPANGTVAGMALELALIMKAPAIIFAGLDLCISDIYSHARPHILDAYLARSDTKLTPAYSQQFIRSREIHHHAHAIYANWFLQRTRSITTPLYRLHPSSVELGISAITEKEMGTLVRRMAPTSKRAAVRTQYQHLPNISPISKRAQVSSVLSELIQQCKAAPRTDWQSGLLRDIALSLAAPQYIMLSRAQERDARSEVMESLQDRCIQWLKETQMNIDASISRSKNLTS